MFLLAEDTALKTKLQGLSVATQNGPQPVKVFFGTPDQNENTRSYPFIQIDLINLIHDTSREHRGRLRLNYIPDNGSGGVNYQFIPNTTPVIDFPIPYLLQYQITTWARSATQNRQIDAMLLSWALAPRFAFLNVPEDGTMRRLDLVSVLPAHTMEGQKRLFRTVYTCNVYSELPLDLVTTLTNVSQVSLINAQGDAAISDAFKILGVVRRSSGYANFKANSSLIATAS